MVLIYVFFSKFRLDGKQDEVDCASSTTGDPTVSSPAIPIVQNPGNILFLIYKLNIKGINYLNL